MRFSLLAILLSASALAPPRVAAQHPIVHDRAEAYVKALSSGDADAFDAMAREQFTPELLERSADRRRAMVSQVHEDFGTLTIAEERITTPLHDELTLSGTAGAVPMTISIDLEANEPHKIAQVSIRVGGPAGGVGRGRGDGPPPAPITPSMHDAEMAAALDGYLAGLARGDGFAGVVLVARDGKPIYDRPFGIADRARQAPMTADLRFNIASIGKAFTKTAIGQLIAAGKLKLTDTVGSILPDYPNAEAKPATIDQLLNFRVGVADFFGDVFARSPKDRFQSNHDYYQFVAPQPLTFLPGARTEYCNGCYIVLGELIARVSGEPYERYIQEHVFAPAGMKTAGFLAYGDPGVATGYTRQSDRDPWTSNVDFHGHHGSAAGGAYAAVTDLLAFDNALRTHVLLDVKTTAWYFGTAEVPGQARATAIYGIAGGAPGANASLESNGTWTVVVLGNLEPPNAVRVGGAVSRALYGG